MLQNVEFRGYEVPRIVKFTETEGGMQVTEGWGMGR